LGASASAQRKFFSRVSASPSAVIFSNQKEKEKDKSVNFFGFAENYKTKKRPDKPSAKERKII